MTHYLYLHSNAIAGTLPPHPFHVVSPHRFYTTMPPRKKPSTKPVNSWNDAGGLMKEYAETLEQQQRVMKALAGFFEDKAGTVR